MKLQSVSYWVIALLAAALLLVYQMVTGPTYPVSARAVVHGHEIKARLPRSYDGNDDAKILVPRPDPAITGMIEFRRYRSHDDWTAEPLEWDGEKLIGRLPHQPPAGKVAYKITLEGAGGDPVALTPGEVVLRFRGAVPNAIVIPHVLGMVLAVLLAVRAGLEALVRGRAVFPLAVGTTVALVVGGLVAGAIMQKAAFGEYWTGWPVGHDLTDSKTLVVAIFWLIAVWRTAKNRASRGWVLAASLLTLVIWLVPHSVLGSELDYTQLES